MAITEIATMLTSIRAATDIAKSIQESTSTLNEAQVNLQIADLINALADTRIDIANLNEQIQEKDAKIKELQSEIDLQGNMEWKAPYYFKIGSNDEKDGPYCQKCYDLDGKLLRLQCPDEDGDWDCKACGSDFQDSTYRPHNYAGPSI